MSMPLAETDRRSATPAILDGYSLEITAKDVAALHGVAHRIPPGTPVAIAFMPGEDNEDRIAATRAVRELGFKPMPHFSARRIASAGEFEAMMKRLADEAGVRRCFVVAGDPPQPAGPFADSSAMIATGLFERCGIDFIGLGGHPEGHPHMTEDQCFEVLAAKCAMVTERGMKPLIVTQFGFSAAPFVRWAGKLRERGIAAPVKLGIPGPAGIKTLLRFAARCGVGASASVMAKYGISLGKLIGTAGPDRLVGDLAAQLRPEHGPIALHFYPFGGLEKTVDWIADHAR